MATLREETITTVLNLQHRLLFLIDQVTATEFIILEKFGETEETIPELDELTNLRERTTSYYVRLYRLLLQVAQSQPVAVSVTLNLLIESIAETEAIVNAGEASNQEIKRAWNLS